MNRRRRRPARPLPAICLCLVLAILTARAIGIPIFGEPRFPEEVGDALAAGLRTEVTGTVQTWQVRENSILYVLKNSSFTFCDSTFRIKKLRVIAPGKEAASVPTGSVVRFAGELVRTEAAGNPGQFDAREYYASLGIHAQLFSERLQVLRRVAGIGEAMAQLRAAMTDALQDALGEESAGVLAAMTLGERALLSEESKTGYRAAGIFHIVCISGLHISMLGLFLYAALFRLFLFLAASPGAGRVRAASAAGIVSRLRRRPLVRRQVLAAKGAAAAVAAAVMGLYCVFVGSPPSAIRAVLMFAVMLGAKLAGRSYDSVNALAMAGILILAPCPGYLFHSGFQLSFAAVAGAAWLYPRVLLALPRRAGAEASGQEGGRAALFWRAGEKLRQGLVLWISVTVVSLPLLARHYSEIPVWGFLANLLLVPLAGIVLASGLTGGGLFLAGRAAAGVAGAALSLAGRGLLLPADLLLRLFGLVAGAVQRLPAAVWICGQPQWWQVGAYYALFCAGAVPVLLRQGARRPAEGREEGRTPRRRWLCALLLLVALVVLFWRPRPAFSLTMLDVGQGDCLVLQSGAQTFLVDGGSTNIAEVGKYRIIPYLKSRGIRRIDGIFLTHGDGDHISGIEEMLQEIAEGQLGFRIGALLMPRWMCEDAAGQRLAAEAEAIGVSVRYLQTGDSITAGELSLRVLAPGAETSGAHAEKEDPADAMSGADLQGNAGSLVLHARYGSLDLLLTGDLEGEGEAAVLPLLSDVDILKVAHHGSRNSTTEAFLAVCRPEICLVSAPDGGRYGHPHQETLDRIAAAGADCFITRDCGAVTVELHRPYCNIRLHRTDVRYIIGT